MDIVTAKFGGSSLASAEQFKKVKKIVEADKRRRYVVPSAPGKVTSNDTKVTDLLYLCYDLARHNINFDDGFVLLKDKYREIVKGIDVDLDIEALFDKIYQALLKGESREFIASRGEYLNGIILAKYLGYEFVDAKDVIFFDEDSNFLEEKSYRALRDVKNNIEHAVIPGFYGSSSKGIKTFSRGGSDLTGSIVARGVGASLYENWTDVSGFLSCDPKIVDNPRNIEIITYKELRELSYGGAGVLHEEAIFPVVSAGIPIEIKNTNAPDAKGTLIVDNYDASLNKNIITGVSGKKDFTVINIEKVRLSQDKSFHRKLMSVLEVNNVFLEHMPSSIDSVSLIVNDLQLQGKMQTLLNEIQTFVSPDNITVHRGISLVTVVGRGMINHVGISAKIFTALAKEDVNILMIIQGSSELNIIIGVAEEDYEKSIKAIYEAF